MTLAEIFTAPAPTLANVAADADEGETQIRENIKQAIASSKAGGEGNAWMKMMNRKYPSYALCRSHVADHSLVSSVRIEMIGSTTVIVGLLFFPLSPYPF